MILTMDYDPQIAGVTPEIAVRDFEMWSGWHWLQYFNFKY